MMFEKYLRGSLGSIIDYLTSFTFNTAHRMCQAFVNPFRLAPC